MSHHLVAGYAFIAEETTAIDGKTVTPFENVTGPGVEYLQHALEEGAYEFPYGTEKNVSLSIESGTIVEYRDTYYEFVIAVGDHPAYEMQISKRD